MPRTGGGSAAFATSQFCPKRNVRVYLSAFISHELGAARKDFCSGFVAWLLLSPSGAMRNRQHRSQNSLKHPKCDPGFSVTLLCGWGHLWRLRKAKLPCGHRFYSQQSWFLNPFSSYAIPGLLCLTWEGSYTWARSKCAAGSVQGRNHISLLRFHSLYGWHGEPLRNGANCRITCAACPGGIFFAFSSFSRK